MSGSQANEVETFSAEGRVSVRLAPPWKAGRLKAAVGDKLGLKSASLSLFGLFEGPLDAPNSILEEDSSVPPHKELCFRRWTMDLTSETRLCHHDDVANNLLFLEAQQQIKRGVGGGGGGVICATPEQARQLEEFADPSFPAERQFLDLARSLPGYGALVAKDVVMETDLVSNDINLHRGNIVTCRLERQRLVILTAEGDEVCWKWELVKRWRTKTSSQLHYEVCAVLGKCSYPHLATTKNTTVVFQAYYLRAGSETTCHYRQNDRVSPKAPRANPNMAGKPFNPLVDFLNSELFRFHRFSSVEK
ncbi:hypothetical protein GBAR_LOCUS5935 [Geodia barretti]|uniref:Uncharacterized protein n=1 Tax=Geodia barretti TaxID=519541 RepID=A0AA35RC14_GEOBA|nr:hypothetical protein GBAR_LOCUS5935 [Geodia barretti]